MWCTRVLRAAVRNAKFLEPGAPTGLTGLLTHSSPRQSLEAIYSATLDALNHVPEASVYRQSVEALSKQRLGIIQSVKPEGFAEWNDKMKQRLETHRKAAAELISVKESQSLGTKAEEKDMSDEEQNRLFDANKKHDEALEAVQALGTEPPLTAEQVDQLEKQIGAGLIEEVVQVAEAERLLVNSMIEHKIWEELVEKPVAGQWEYYARDRHVPTTQTPPA